MYVALRNIEVEQGGKMVTIPSGHPVDVSSWSDFSIRANVRQGLIKETMSSVTVETTVKRPVTTQPKAQPKKAVKEGAKVASAS